MLRLLIRLFDWLGKLPTRLRGWIGWFNRRMRTRYQPRWLAAIVLAVLAVVMTVMLFVPPYLGLSNDGSFDSVLADMNLARFEEDTDDVYFSYYERVYRLEPIEAKPGTTPFVLRAMVGAAIGLDTLLTHDDLFDMRFLAALYVLLYLAVLYPLLVMLLKRVRNFSEGMVLSVACVLIFGDVSVITRFASLDTAPLEWLLLLALLLLLMRLAQKQGRGAAVALLPVATLLLMNVNVYCALAGMVFSAVYWRLAIMRERSSASKIMLVLCAAALCVVSSFQLFYLVDTQSPVRKYNQMTRGVLLQADNPEEALAAFGIEPRYSVLAETYADQEYPVVLPSGGTLDEGFFDHYGTGDVAVHYMRHPLALGGMMDLAVHRAFIARSDYSGNYERSVGLPARAKSPFMALWSTFKSQSAPRTLAFFAVLLAGLFYVTKAPRGKRVLPDDPTQLMRSFWAVLFTFGVAEVLSVILLSGDAELIRESYFLGGCVDLCCILLLCEALRRLKIITAEE